MKKIKYCLPIIKDTKKEVLKSLKIKGFDFYEVWLDYIKDLDEKFVVDIALKFKEKLIFVFRRQNLEPIKLPLEKRLNLISLISKSSAYIDLDFLTQHEELESLIKNPNSLKLILSYHNYKETQKLDYFVNLITKMKRYNPEVYKVATFCQTKQDVLILLELILKLKDQKLKYIVLGMGEEGQVTRIVGSIWGNEINFTPQHLTEKSAKGQLTKKSLELVLKEIN